MHEAIIYVYLRVVEQVDGTGEIQVEIDGKIFPKEPVSGTTKVTISGEVDKDLIGKVEVDVKTMLILK